MSSLFSDVCPCRSAPQQCSANPECMWHAMRPACPSLRSAGRPERSAPSATLGRTRNVSYSLAHPGGGPDATKKAKRDSSFVSQTGAPEDRALTESVTRAMASGANEHFTFGHFESALVHFHRNLHAALEEPDLGRRALDG